MKNLLKSFKHAISGFWFCVKYERNIRIHIAATLYVLYFSGFYSLERAEFILVIFICLLVIVTEMLNTSIEVMVDKVSPQYHTLAKIAKNVAAGAVFITSAVAVFVGILLFWDVAVFKEIAEYFAGNAAATALLVISITAMIIFITSGKKRKRKKYEK